MWQKGIKHTLIVHLSYHKFDKNLLSKNVTSNTGLVMILGCKINNVMPQLIIQLCYLYHI